MSEQGIKLVVVGDGAVGKTSLLTVLKGEEFPARYVPTIFENYIQDFPYNDKNYKIHIWDTPGQDEFDRLRPISYQDAKVILLCFAHDKRASFVNVSERWLAEVQYYCKDARIILVGMKNDLIPDATDAVTNEEAQKLSADNKFTEYISTSAKLDDNVDKIFPAVVNACAQKKKSKCLLI